MGLAGFAGVAVVLGRSPERWGPGDALRIRLLLNAAFTAMFAALLATGSHWAGAEVAASVRLGAGALLAGQLYFALVLGRRIRHLDPSEEALFDPGLARLIQAVAYASMGAQTIVISGQIPRVAPWLFLLGLLSCLAYAALGFVRLMFIRPSSE